MSVVYLPTDIICTVFVDWMTMIEMAFMDSAYCSKISRNIYLQLLGEGHIFSGISNFASETYLHWLKSRNIAVKELLLQNFPYFNRESFSYVYGYENLSLLSVLKLNKCDNNMLLVLQSMANYCTKLTTLCLTNSHYLKDNIIIKFLDKNPRLTSVSLSGCSQISDQVVMELSMCQHLESLMLRKCAKLSDMSLLNLPPHMKRPYKVFPALTQLSLSECRELTGGGIATAVECLSTLQDISFAHCRNVSDRIVTRVATACNLRLVSLDITMSDTSDASCLSLARHCPRLAKLVMDDCTDITDVAVEAITLSCSDLEHISLSSNVMLTDASLHAIAAHCPYLTFLDVSKCVEVTDVGVTAISEHCVNLKHLYLSWCDDVTDEAIIKVAQKCVLLQSLDVSQCIDLTDNSITLIIESCSELQLLNIVECFNITSATIQRLGSCCHLLKQLNIARCEEVTDEGLLAVSEGCPLLENLNVAWCNELTDSSLLAITSRCTLLQRVDFSRVSNMTDAVIIRLSESCKWLVKLNVMLCTALTDMSMHSLARNCLRLEELDITNCNQISNNGIKALESGCPALTTLYCYCKKSTHPPVLRTADAVYSLIETRPEVTVIMNAPNDDDNEDGDGLVEGEEDDYDDEDDFGFDGSDEELSDDLVDTESDEGDEDDENLVIIFEPEP